MRFKVGDKVRVREDLEVDKRYGGQVFVDDMERYRGEVMEIESAWNAEYYLKEDQWHWTFTDEMLEPIEDPLAAKIEERNKKSTSNTGDPIKPSHYRKGEIDLYESWYRTYPFNEFRAGMQMIAERYMKRDKDNRIQDLDKARYTLERLKEYEEHNK